MGRPVPFSVKFPIVNKFFTNKMALKKIPFTITWFYLLGVHNCKSKLMQFQETIIFTFWLRHVVLCLDFPDYFLPYSYSWGKILFSSLRLFSSLFLRKESNCSSKSFWKQERLSSKVRSLSFCCFTWKIVWTSDKF